MKHIIPLLSVATVLALVILLIAGCATEEPQTPRERLAAAEVTYEAALLTIRDLAAQGTIPEALKPRVVELIQSARLALNVWHQVPDDMNRRQAAITALTRLNIFITNYLQRLENNGSNTPGTPSSWRPHQHRFESA